MQGFDEVALSAGVRSSLLHGSLDALPVGCQNCGTRHYEQIPHAALHHSAARQVLPLMGYLDDVEKGTVEDLGMIQNQGEDCADRRFIYIGVRGSRCQMCALRVLNNTSLNVI